MESTKLSPLPMKACCAACAPVAPTPEADNHEHGCACCHDHDHDHENGHDHEKREIVIMAVSALLFAIGMVADERLAEIMPNWLVICIFYALPYILCGYDVLRIGAQSILKKDFFNEFTLMGGATIAAIALGQLPEAVGVMLFYCVGEFVQERAAGRSRRSVKALLAARKLVEYEDKVANVASGL